MVDQKREVHRLLLSIVVSNKQNWLDVAHGVANADHAEEETRTVLLPTLEDVAFHARVHHKVVFNDADLRENLHVELLLENLLEEDHLLGGAESLKVVLGLQHERKSLILVLKVHHHANLLSLAVEYTIAESDQDEAELVWAARVVVDAPADVPYAAVVVLQQAKVFRLVPLLGHVEVVDGCKLVQKDLLTIDTDHEHVVRLPLQLDVAFKLFVSVEVVAEHFVDSRVIQNVIVRHLKGQLAKHVPLREENVVNFDNHFEHARVSETAGLVKWVVSKAVGCQLLLFDEARIVHINESLCEDKAYDALRVIFDCAKEGRHL